MADEKPGASLLIGTIVCTKRGVNPTGTYFLLGMPDETMEQLASRTEIYAEQMYGKQWQNYGGATYGIMLGSLTHQIEPPPPPAPKPVVKIQEIPTAVPNRKSLAAKLKFVKKS
jgi:hypothetical protein